MKTSRTTVVFKDGWKDGALAIVDGMLAIANGARPDGGLRQGQRRLLKARQQVADGGAAARRVAGVRPRVANAPPPHRAGGAFVLPGRSADDRLRSRVAGSRGDGPRAVASWSRSSS